MSKRRPPSPGRRETHEGWYSHFLGNRRTLTVCVPPGYDDDAKRRCPVLYLHDGQNLFDPARAAFGASWEADATAERLILARRIPPLLLVGIDNTPDRLDEYGCHRDAEEQTGGRGPLYARFVLEEVKPFIDGRYRTRPERRNTAVAGSSMGGLISLSMAREHPDRFGLCGVASPSLWWADGAGCRRSRTTTRPGCGGCASGWTWARARAPRPRPRHAVDPLDAAAGRVLRRSRPYSGSGLSLLGNGRRRTQRGGVGGAVRQDAAVFLWEMSGLTMRAAGTAPGAPR